ncbi:UpaP162 family type II restriction enzyme [Mesoplasma florum]|uniref:UpaP162 family type II restriction enzyme n=1 Tax=Mesoplasma florum TaxID=2151 RepID=UPI000BE3F53B|nr:hypothetical protein [Mesoplasma florum]ATI73271.1 hypothetical protein CQZ69_01680 [Mesoplasma florum]AVN61673.1 hypothetical protein CG004_01680 [Mesoplasma florum]
MNNYQKDAKFCIKDLREKIQKYIESENNEFKLELNGINLLEDKLSAVKSSTAFGYCIEEFFSKKLSDDYPDIFKRVEGGTQGSSFDLLRLPHKEETTTEIMINFKASLLPADANNGIAALNKLFNDYSKEIRKEKLYLICKFKYSIEQDGIVKIKEIDLFYLEQVPFCLIGQDKRNWSSEFNFKSGRLQVSKKTIKNSLKPLNEISYISFLDFLTEKCKD